MRLSFADADPIYFSTEGDCCSESWWADIVGAAGCYGAIVREVREVELPEEDPEPERTRQEYDALYGIDIVTDKGVINTVFRNSSNGYYGGEAHLIKSHDGPWQEIASNDWRA